MLEIRKKLKIARGAYAVEVKGQLRLPFDLRQKSRLRAALVSGEEVGLDLPRGDLLRGGDLLVASDGRVIEVVAQPEKVLHVTCSGAQALARAAYHLGNRHVPVEVGEDYLRIASDHVLAQLLDGLGATVEELDAPFEPEAGAYGEGHAHGGGGHDDLGHGGKIHEYGAAHDHAHDHHDHEHCDHHDHGHDHKHGHHHHK